MAAGDPKGSALLFQAAEWAGAAPGRNQHTPRTAGPEGSQNPTRQSFCTSLQARRSFIAWWRSSKQRPQLPKPLWDHFVRETARACWCRVARGRQCCSQAVDTAGPWPGLTWHCQRAANGPACGSSGNLPDQSSGVSEGRKAWHPLVWGILGASSQPLFSLVFLFMHVCYVHTVLHC